MRRNGLITIAVLIVFTLSAAAQQTWIPYSAKITETIDKVDKNGQHTLVVKMGVKYQSSNGMSREEYFYPNTLSPKDGKVIDPNEKVVYCYSHSAKRAIGKSSAVGHARLPKTPIIGHENIGGIAATGYYVYDSPVTKKPVGEIWFADASPDIVVRTKNLLDNGGSVTHELSEIQLNQEPDEKLTQIPNGFEISKPVNNSKAKTQ